jgi:hypothetical protein
MTFAGVGDVVGFIVGDVRWDITLDGKNYVLLFTSQELIEMVLQEKLTP